MAAGTSRAQALTSSRLNDQAARLLHERVHNCALLDAANAGLECFERQLDEWEAVVIAVACLVMLAVGLFIA